METTNTFKANTKNVIEKMCVFVNTSKFNISKLNQMKFPHWNRLGNLRKKAVCVKIIFASSSRTYTSCVGQSAEILKHYFVSLQKVWQVRYDRVMRVLLKFGNLQDEDVSKYAGEWWYLGGKKTEAMSLKSAKHIVIALISDCGHGYNEMKSVVFYMIYKMGCILNISLTTEIIFITVYCVDILLL